MVVYHNKLLYHHHVRLDKLHDQDLYLWIVHTIYVFQFQILVDRYNLCYYSMMLDFVYLNDYVDELFHSMYGFHRQVFVNELMLLHDMQVNENHAMDNHFDWMNAMVHEVMMMI